MDLGGVSKFVHCCPAISLTDLGWRFVTPDENLPGENVVPDPFNGAQNIPELYLLADPNYSGRFSVPVLWDKKLKTIVSNESSEIIRMLNSEFDSLLGEEFRGLNLVPNEFEEKIDDINAWIYVSPVFDTLMTGGYDLYRMLTERRTISTTVSSE
jgi:glutathionyl-hydroquinone reductase